MYVCTCTVTVRFDDDDVVEWLVDNEEITDDDFADSYSPSRDEIERYAWELIEQDEGEYGSISVN